MVLEGVMRLSYKDLVSYTDNFCASNYIGFFQFGKLYRGNILRAESVQYVMVKIWEVSETYRYSPGDNEYRLMDEIILLRHEKMVNHPGMVKLYGFCFEVDHLGVVYQFKPMDSIYNLIPKDGFSWLQRINVAIGVASLLKFLHSVKSPDFKLFRVRNLDCAHIMLDEDFNPKLCDFGLITGGIFPDRSGYIKRAKFGCNGYMDYSAYARAPKYEDKKDVYAFGAILLSLISKRVYNSEEDCKKADVQPVGEWAEDEFYKFYYPPSDEEGSKSKQQKLSKKSKFSLVHPSLSLAINPNYDPADAHEITLLGLRCVEGACYGRPTMRQVLRSLLRLKVVKEHADFLGVKKAKNKEKSCRMKMEESPMMLEESPMMMEE